MSRIAFKEGDLKWFWGSLPQSLDMTGVIVKIQVRSEAGSRVVLEFCSDNENGLLTLAGRELFWIIPGNLTVGKAGKYQWQAVIYCNEIDPIRTKKDSFEIISSIAKL